MVGAAGVQSNIYRSTAIASHTNFNVLSAGVGESHKLREKKAFSEFFDATLFLQLV
jgi:hypothetical protein